MEFVFVAAVGLFLYAFTFLILRWRLGRPTHRQLWIRLVIATVVVANLLFLYFTFPHRR